MKSRGLLIAAVCHFVHPVEKDSSKHHKLTQTLSASVVKVNKFQDAV